MKIDQLLHAFIEDNGWVYYPLGDDPETRPSFRIWSSGVEKERWNYIHFEDTGLTVVQMLRIGGATLARRTTWVSLEDPTSFSTIKHLIEEQTFEGGQTV